MIVKIIFLLFILILVIGFNSFLSYRNKKVYEFNLKIIDDCHRWCERHQHEDITWITSKIPDYKIMLISIKPLKMEKWFSSEIIRKLYS